MKLSVEGLNQLINGTVILTPNLRLSRALVTSHGQHQHSKGNQVWEHPAIFAIEMWLQQQWQHIQPVHALLSNAQSTLLWEQVINDLSPTLNANSVVTAAEQAYELCYLWQLDTQDAAFLHNENSREWGRWVNEFEKRMSANGFISRPHAIQQLIVAAKKEQFIKQPHVVLMGFDGIAPLYQELLNNLFEKVEFGELGQTTTDIIRCVVSDVDDEIKQAAQYAKQTLTQNPDATIGIIVSDLTVRREHIEKVFIDVFEPQAMLPSAERYALPFNFSAGEPLKRIPLVRVALQLLAINGRAFELDTILSLLKSPFIKGYHGELVPRAMLATKLLEEKRKRVSLDKLIAIASDFSLSQTEKRYQCPQLVESLKKLKPHVGQQQKRLPGQWHNYFINTLELMGYTFDTINSIEYQQREQFLEQIAQLETLDDLLGVVDHTHANRLVNRLVQQGVFQPKTRRSPIQVLGLLEGAGLTFTHVWVTGMHDKTWPPAPNPNPFIPYHLQRDKNIPHATAARELAFTKTLFEQYLAGTQHMVVSYPAQEEGQDLRASSLIRHYSVINADELITKTTQTFIEQVYSTHILESFTDVDSNAIGETESTRGGTGILKDQSLCAFRAFANHRLKAKPLESVDEGLTKAERGTLLHACMKNVWDVLGSHAHLMSLDETSLMSVISDAVKKETVKLPRELGNQFIEIENTRLLQLITVWLEVEKLRPPFTVIGTEANEKIAIGNLLLNVYVDRIDEVNGVQLVIDYKTSGSPPSVAAWKGKRPDDPQLPLYAISGEGNVRGIYFAHVTSKSKNFIGVSENNALIPIKALSHSKWEKEMGSWADAINQWKMVLEKLVNDFLAGKASVDPTIKACEYCHLNGLCRIHLGELS